MATMLMLVVIMDCLGTVFRWSVFGSMSGLMFLFDVWIDWTAFATLHFCSVMVVGMAGGLDLMNAFMLKK